MYLVTSGRRVRERLCRRQVGKVDLLWTPTGAKRIASKQDYAKGYYVKQEVRKEIV